MTLTVVKPVRSLCWIVLTASLVVAGPGCGSRLAQVQGVVKLDGKPVPAAMVEFLPLGGKGQPANGVTDSSGAFHLDTLSSGDGAWPGEYKVVVRKYEVDPAMQQPIDPSDPKAQEKQYAAAAKVMAKPKKHLIPDVYRNHETTPLRWKVPDDNNKTLELTSTGK
jgi:hypothetical protein